MTQFYLSLNTTYEAGDTLIGSRPVRDARRGRHAAPEPANVVIPASATTGSYYIIARADGADAIAETIETNNTAAALVGLAPTCRSRPSPFPGAAGAGRHAYRLRHHEEHGRRLSERLGDPVLPLAEHDLRGRRHADWLAPRGDSRRGRQQRRHGQRGDSRRGDLLARTTSSHRPTALDAIAETIEANNTAADLVRIGPDLSLTGLSATRPVGAGATITVKTPQMNTGGGTSAPSVTQFYLSAQQHHRRRRHAARLARACRPWRPPHRAPDRPT